MKKNEQLIGNSSLKDESMLPLRSCAPVVTRTAASAMLNRFIIAIIAIFSFGISIPVSSARTSNYSIPNSALQSTIIGDTTYATACGSYYWSESGHVYYNSGTYSHFSGSSNKILVLIVNEESEGSKAVITCSCYYWNGSQYSTSGVYTAMLSNHLGCDSLATLYLTINQPYSNTVPVSACDNYTWNGVTYTSSGLYSFSGIRRNGCDSTVQLQLTINNSTSNTSTVTSCGPYLWTEDNQVYSSSGRYSHTVGCHTEILDLTVSSLSASATITSPIACFGGTAVVNVNATGGTGPYYGTGQQTSAAGEWFFTVTDDEGCTATTGSVVISEPPKVQGSVTSTSSFCGTSVGTATVTGYGGSGGFSYSWSDGQSGSFIQNLAPGNYSVVISDANGCTGTASIAVSDSGTVPTAAGAISGPQGACRGAVLTYSIPPVSGATSYDWTLPIGATGSSNSNSITVTMSSTYSGGFICVTPMNACGAGSSACVNVPVLTVKPAQPKVVNLSAQPCGPTVITCSVPAVANATSYDWTVSSPALTILSGQGTSTITLQVAAGFVNATLAVNASNCVGASSYRYVSLTGMAVINTGLTGPLYLCPNSTQSYSVGAATGATSYAWSITGDASILNSNGPSCMVRTGSTWNGGILTVAAINACGSNPRSFTLSRNPLQPGGISGPAYGLCRISGVSSATYSIAAVSGATSYSWTVPAGMTIVSNSGTSITVSIGTTFTSGNVCVSANNSCGTGTARCLIVTSKPQTPGAISGPVSVCKTQYGISYSVAPIQGVTGYAWSISGGASISGNTTTGIADFRSATLTSSVITLNSLNQCGASSPSKLTVAVNLLCRVRDNVIENRIVSAYPNPTSRDITVEYEVSKPGKVDLKLYDLLGESLYSESFNNPVSGSYKIELPLQSLGLATGIYSLRLLIDGKPYEVRVVKQ